MLTLYLVCLIIGGGLLALSLFSGNDDFSSDADFSGDADLHIDSTASEIEMHTDTDAIHSNDNDPGDAVKLLSLRNLVYFTSFFGLAGSLLATIGTGAIITFLSSLFIGAISMLFGHKLLKYLKSTETGQGVELNSLVGCKAFVSLAVRKSSLGKIIVELNGQTIELNAAIASSSNKDIFNYRENVIIVDLENNTAKIIETDF